MNIDDIFPSGKEMLLFAFVMMLLLGAISLASALSWWLLSGAVAASSCTTVFMMRKADRKISEHRRERHQPSPQPPDLSQVSRFASKAAEENWLLDRIKMVRYENDYMQRYEKETYASYRVNFLFFLSASCVILLIVKAIFR